jgi:hypothetical protein
VAASRCAYTTGELLARLVQAWRAPLSVGAIGVVALSVVLALAARQSTIDRATADRHLGQVLTQQALTALTEDRGPAAEILAAHALKLGPSPLARGVLAATAGPRPERLRSIELPEICQRSGLLSEDGALIACVTGERFELWEVSPLRLRWSQDVRVSAGPIWDRGLLVQVGDEVRRVSLDDGTLLASWLSKVPLTLFAGPVGIAPGLLAVLKEGQPPDYVKTCSTGRVSTTVARGMVVARCDDGMLQVYDTLGTMLREIPIAGPADWSTLTPIESGVLIGTFSGAVTQIDPLTGAMTPTLVGFEGPVVRLQPVPGTPMVAALGESGRLRIWNTEFGTWVGTLPGHVGRVFPGTNPGEIVLLGKSLETWQLPEHRRPHAIRLRAGLTQVAISPDGEQVAYALGTGEVSLRRVVDGEELWAGNGKMPWPSVWRSATRASLLR